MIQIQETHCLMIFVKRLIVEYSVLLFMFAYN